MFTRLEYKMRGGILNYKINNSELVLTPNFQICLYLVNTPTLLNSIMTGGIFFGLKIYPYFQIFLNIV